MLEQRVLDLELGEHVEFDDRFLAVDELADLLAATDVFVTPYASREQSSSGALTFALAAGCAAVSTPYWYASDLLSSGAGTLVDFGDSDGTRRRRLRLDRATGAARCCARRGARASVRRSVGRRSVRRPLQCFARRSSRRRAAAPIAGRRARAAGCAHRPPADAGRRLRRSSSTRTARSRTAYTGYCVDDVARLAVVALELERRTGDRVWAAVLYRSLAFLIDASDPDGAGMRNFMSYDRRWLDEPHVGDHVGRSIWALGDVLDDRLGPGARRSGAAAARLARALARPASSRSARRRTPLLGLARLDPDRLSPTRSALLERCVTQLEAAHHVARARAGAGSRMRSPTTTPACRRR